MVCPCKGCPARYQGCHDWCKRFLAFRDWARAKNKRERDAQRSESFYKEMPWNMANSKY